MVSTKYYFSLAFRISHIQIDIKIHFHLHHYLLLFESLSYGAKDLILRLEAISSYYLVFWELNISCCLSLEF